MFTILAALIVYCLLTYGAVLPDSWLLVSIIWLGCITGLLVKVTLRGQWRKSAFIVLALAIVSFAFLQPKLAIGFAAGFWAWVAASGAGPKQTLRFFHFLIFIGVLEASIGLVQFFISPGWILAYANPNYRSSGTLINQNHFAGMLEMLIPVALGFAYIAVRRHREMARIYVYLLLGAFMGLALLFSLSRTGIFSFLLTALFLGLLLRLRDSKQRLTTGLVVGLLLALAVAGALWIGIDAIVQRYAELVGKDAVLHEARVFVYRDTIRMIAANPWGVGAGHYQDAFRQYQTFRPDLFFDHAHNDYLETTAEWGVPFAVIFWGFILFILVRSARVFLGDVSPEVRGILLACIGAIFAILVHSLTDFNLQIPSNAILFFTFIGVAAAQTANCPIDGPIK